ncbi:MAG: dihydroorotase [Crocinitomicaceae bacterium]|nr:dihydroorotase [Crocinitomicaceae bacterium]|tara:strand:- start:560 stop:1906 length:1347 start_codon:yes stop_codon:yes gene_type:complete
MSISTLIRNAHVVNEGTVTVSDVLIVGDSIAKIGKGLDVEATESIDATGLWLMPGIIDDQVHFREPGLTHKADLKTESKAAAAGGVTSFMEMPNTVPQALTQQLLQDKYERAAEVSAVNYSFFMGASNNNLNEVLKTDPKRVCGVKVFMGSSTGDMLVDERKILEGIFKESPTIVATHCEEEAVVRANMAAAKERWGERVPIGQHPFIRSAEACYQSSSKAIELATKHGARLHILHISTARELELFDGNIPLKEKKITSEACIHHLWFTDADYADKGTYIKWNPAVKSEDDRNALRAALQDGRIDVIATDHAPHTVEEKSRSYFKAPSGGPLVQHGLPAMLELVHQGEIEIEKVIDLMCHRVAELFEIKDRGYIREGYKADLVLVNPDANWTVTGENILYKCGWSPFTGYEFKSHVTGTWVNGVRVWDGVNILTEEGNHAGERLEFNR